MLLLDDGLEINSVTLFRDHSAPGTFHYLPGPPQVVIEDGQARAQIIRFRGFGKTGGFLSLNVQLTQDAALLSSVREELGSRFGVEPNLVPVLFNQGSTRLVALNFEQPPAGAGGAGGLFVESLLGSSVPSLMGRQRAIFEVRLTAEGSTLIESALRTGTAPALVVYDLEFSGLVPARGLLATIQYQMSYDYLRSRFAMNSLYFKADLDREAETLARKGLIKIEDVDFQGVDASTRAKREEEVRATLSQLMQGLFFRPSASPASTASGTVDGSSAAAAAWAAQGRPTAAFLMRSLEQHEDDLITYDLRETRVATKRVAPQGALRLPPGTDTSRLMIDTTLDWPPPITSVHAFTLPEATWSGVSAIQIDLRQKEQVHTIVLSPAQPEQTVNLGDGPVEYSVSLKAEREPEALGALPPADPAFHPLPSSNLFFDPRVLSGRRELRITLGAIDFGAVNKVSGTLAAGGEQRVFQLDAATRDLVLPVWGNGALDMHVDLAFSSGDRASFDRVIHATDPVVVINQPAGQFRVVAVMLQDPLNRYASVSVTLESSAGERQANLTLDASTPLLSWSSTRSGELPAAYRYKVRKVKKDSTVVDGEWTEALGSLLVVGDLDIRLDAIQGVLLGAAGTLGALIRIVSANPPEDVDAVQEILLEADQTAFSANVPFARAAARQYTVSGQIFLPSGTVDLPPRPENSEVLLILMPGPEPNRAARAPV